MIVSAFIVPHSFHLIEALSDKAKKDKIKKTLESLELLRLSLERTRPDTIVIISPHGEMENYHFLVNSATVLKNPNYDFDFSNSGKLKNDLELVSAIEYSVELVDHIIHLKNNYLDYGALVPLSFLLKNIQPKIVHLSHSYLSFEKHYRYGEIMSNIFRKNKKRIAIIASGELSHKLNLSNLTNDIEKAQFFDHWVLQHLASNDTESLISMEREDLEEYRECGLRSFLILLGAIYQERYKFKMLSYEYPLGVGYLTACFL